MRRRLTEDQSEEYDSMSAECLKKEICQYRKLVKAQRKVLESLSRKVGGQEKLEKSLRLAEKKLASLGQQLEYYRAKSKILEREMGPSESLSQAIFEEIQRKRARAAQRGGGAEAPANRDSSAEGEDEFDRLSSGDWDREKGARPEGLLEKTRSEVDEIVEELTKIRESEDFGKVARRLLDLRQMLNNS